jgi:hypothetical protein
VLEFILHILICIMVLGISFFPAQMVKTKGGTLANMAGITGLLGLLLVGTGIYIGGAEAVHSYHYITFIVQLIILGLFLLIYHLFKKVGYSKLININSICLAIISQLTYVYYIIASFIY